MTTLRIHHFFDMIRDYGNDTVLEAHPFGHSYHIVGNDIFNNKIVRIKLTTENDDVCRNCVHLKGGKCRDVISHRSDFKNKEDFNTHIDNRIMKLMGYRDGQVLSVSDILSHADCYIANIFEIYDGNDTGHTELRKRSVEKGVQKKSENQSF